MDHPKVGGGDVTGDVGSASTPGIVLLGMVCDTCLVTPLSVDTASPPCYVVTSPCLYCLVVGGTHWPTIPLMQVGSDEHHLL